MTQPITPSCPQCGKAIRTAENVYEWPQINGVLTKVKVGTRERVNPFKPFCTLRCGWRYGQQAYRARRKR